MKVTILFFGIAKDLAETSSSELEIEKEISVLQFKEVLKSNYPKLKNISSYAIAVNEEYANDSLTIKNNDTIAIIPPVSGG